MSTDRVRWMSARPGLRLAGLMMVLAGLIGMHGLGGHDAVAMEDRPKAGMADMPIRAAQADAGVTAGLGHQIDEVGAQGGPETDAVGASGPGGMGMKAMCVAILAAGLIALARFLLSGRVRSVLGKAARQTQAVLQHRGRDPDPPSLIALSIQRC